jgi:uncharacterized protein
MTALLSHAASSASALTAADYVSVQPTAVQLRSLISIHDVMPTNLGDVAELIELCAGHHVRHPTLLVVPGSGWSEEQLEKLHLWQKHGCELACHGWAHRCAEIKSLKHRIHSRLLSRDVAEHLSLSRGEVLDLMERCATWFADHQFGIPDLYVPPAWALGKLHAGDLVNQPFNMVETLTRIHFANGHYCRLPLLSFDASSAGRSFFLAWLNRVTRGSLRQSSLVRIAIHPTDHRLPLHSDLLRSLALPMQPITYATLRAMHR